MEKTRLLVVDDEPQVTRVLRRSLTAYGYEVRTAADGDAALDTYNDFHPELIITDLQMPEMTGIELCRAVRKMSQIPIIVLSVKGEEETKVAALDAGADDYITKPFGMDELLARIRANLRRTTGDSRVATLIEKGDFSIDLGAHAAIVRGEKVHLTPKEFELLVFLLRNDGRVLTHKTILKAVWGENATEQTEYLRVFLGTLRKKIEIDPSEPRYILTEPWVGYRLVAGD